VRGTHIKKETDHGDSSACDANMLGVCGRSEAAAVGGDQRQGGTSEEARKAMESRNPRNRSMRPPDSSMNTERQ
jgi:hypothetical protein